MTIFTEKLPGHFGNVAWGYHATDIIQEAERDLLWRVLQTSPDEVTKVVHAFWPAAQKIENAFHVDGSYQVLLQPEVCGAFCLIGGSCSGAETWGTQTGSRIPANAGLYLGPLFETQKGFKESEIPFHIARRANIPLSVKGRYLFDKKACHERVLLENSDATFAAITETLKQSFIAQLGYTCEDYLHYNTENNLVDFAVARFRRDNDTVQVPITAWKAVIGPMAGRVVFDLLHPAAPYALWGAEKISLFRDRAHSSAVVCGDGYDAHMLSWHHSGLHEHYAFTAYSAISGSDWGSLGRMPVIILPKYGPEGSHEAFKLYKKLRSLGTHVRFLPRGAKTNDSASLAQDAVPALLRGENISIEEFAVFCRAEYGIEPPDGILPQGVPILELNAEEKQEVLLDGLLCLGHQMTIFAKQGTGKSLFALNLMLRLAAGIEALGGRIPPARKYKVLLIDYELTALDLKTRASAMAKTLGIQQEIRHHFMVRSALSEGSDLLLENDAGWNDLLPDMNWADIIVVDSLFKAFPSAMGNEFTGTDMLNKFYAFCKTKNKTAIVIDHQGKSGDTPIGSMGKAVAVDAVLHLTGEGKIKTATIKKLRHFPTPTSCWLRYSVQDDGDGIHLVEVSPTSSSSLMEMTSQIPTPVALEKDEVPSQQAESDTENPIDTAIIETFKRNPDTPKGDIIKKLCEAKVAARSTLYARYKVLKERRLLGVETISRDE